MKIPICGISELGDHCEAGVTHVLSILDPAWPDPEAVEGLSVILRDGLGPCLAAGVTPLLAAAHAYTYYEQMRTEDLERAQLERALASSELQALKSQLHPHFLFNTLHGIATLIDTDRTTDDQF